MPVNISEMTISFLSSFTVRCALYMFMYMLFMYMYTCCLFIITYTCCCCKSINFHFLFRVLCYVIQIGQLAAQEDEEPIYDKLRSTENQSIQVMDSVLNSVPIIVPINDSVLIRVSYVDLYGGTSPLNRGHFHKQLGHILCPKCSFLQSGINNSGHFNLSQ